MLEKQMIEHVLKSSGRHAVGVLALSLLAALGAHAPAAAQAVSSRGAIDQAVTEQIATLLQEKASRTDRQQKLGSHLWYALQASRGQAISGLPELYTNAGKALDVDAAGRAKVKISASVTSGLLNQIAAAGGSVKYSSAKNKIILASVPLGALETLAINSDVSRIVPAARARTNVGGLTSQGYISHKANQVIASGRDGTGVRVGVLSDSVDALNALIASGDLPADTVVLPGQDGGAGSSEGTAMMEIVHDIAPGAKLYFATAFNGSTSFADNIRALRDVYHCDIIVDDVSYFDEAAFQDGEIAKAVNDVTASGALYFSSAANSGNLTSGTSGTWEGDFTPGSASASPLPAGYTLHAFATGQPYNVLTGSTTWIAAHWSDPLGQSSNDYDLFLLSPSGSTIWCASTDVQTGVNSDPLEACYYGSGWPVGTRVVIAKKAAAEPRALHVDTQRGRLSIATGGATIGHNAGKNTVSTAAVYWNSARTGTKAFVGGAANPTEVFSSDGPRKIFFNPDGTPITPGNLLFSSNGGSTLNKPEIAAADGVSTKTPGFLPFYGTSAAAPHAAGIAALIKQARPDYTNAQILAALKATALDIRATGVDRDAGYGLVMAWEAVNYALTH